MRVNTIMRISRLIIGVILVRTVLGISAAGAEEPPKSEQYIQKAYEYGLTYPGIMSDFGKPITREEFCTLAVKLYQKLSNRTASPGGGSFTDTKNPEVMKAYGLGIVKGIGDGKFSPNSSITRQEICVTVFRTLEKAITDLDKSAEGSFPFRDQDLIAPWAIDAMKHAYRNNVMYGTVDNKIEPLSNTTREQAIVLVKRTYEIFGKGVIGGTNNEDENCG